MLIDNFSRIIDRLRIVITSRCNYQCFFCHNEGIRENVNDMLNTDDISLIVKVCKRLGINRFKITGGEPLIRSDIINIIKTINSYEPSDFIIINKWLLLKYPSS